MLLSIFSISESLIALIELKFNSIHTSYLSHEDIKMGFEAFENSSLIRFLLKSLCCGFEFISSLFFFLKYLLILLIDTMPHTLVRYITSLNSLFPFRCPFYFNF